MFDSIFYNGEEYKQIWLDGVLVWEKVEKEEIIYPYPDCDCCIYVYGGAHYSTSNTLTVIDETLPYSVNGVVKTTVSTDTNPNKIINLKPMVVTNSTSESYSLSLYYNKIEQLRLPNLRDLSGLFRGFAYRWTSNSNIYTASWQPQYFEFHPYPTNTKFMFANTFFANDMMAEFVPVMPSTEQVVDMSYMFFGCQGGTDYDKKGAITLNPLVSNFDTRNVTSMSNMFNVCYVDVLDLSKWNTSKTTNMEKMFYSCTYLTDLNLARWDVSNVESMIQMFYGCSKLTSLDLTLWDVSNVENMKWMFGGCTSLKELHLESWDTSKVKEFGSMFSNMSCDVYISDRWTLGTSSTLSGGKALNFILVEQPIKSINNIELVGVKDINNVTEKLFEVKIKTDDWYSYSDLEILYDENYISYDSEKKVFKLLDGSQGKTFDITYRSKTDNSISKTITFTVADIIFVDGIDFTQETAPKLPTWFTEQTKDSTYWFEHGTYANDSSIYGLVNSNRTNNGTTAWTCYKLVAPITAPLQITYRAYEGRNSSSYPFTIHITTSASQPSYSSSSNRIVYEYSSTDTGEKSVTYDVVEGTTYYIHLQKYRYYYSSSKDDASGAVVRSIKLLQPIGSIDLSYDVDLSNINQKTFTIKPIILPTAYDENDLEIIYDSNCMSVNPTTFEIRLKDGSQGKSHTITYRSKENNDISKSITFYVNADLVLLEPLIDFTQSTAPILPSYMILDGEGSSYSFSHGTFTTDVYGLIPNNKGKDSSIAYTRYKYVAPTSGDLTFTYRCYAETNYDYLTVHVDTSTSQPYTTSATNQVFTTKGVSSYQNTDGTASVSVVEGTTYYIHIQYYKDGSSHNGYDKGCIRKIELL